MNSPERCVVLPTPGDPFLLTYWYKYFKPCLELGFVDRLIVVGNSPLLTDTQQATNAVTKYLRDMFEDQNVSRIFYTHYTDHGEAIRIGLSYIPNDANVMLIEDDCIVLKPEAIRDCFILLENNPDMLVASPRHSCSNEIIDRATEKFGLLKAPCQEVGVNFWPSFFFSKKEVLAETDQVFGAKSWQAGEYCEPLDYTFKEFANGDTFVNTSLQIRAKHNKIALINQGHLHQHDDQFYTMKKSGSDQFCGIWSWPDPAWVHIGSLSMCLQTMLLDGEGYPLDGSGNKRSLDDLNMASKDIYAQATFWVRKFVFEFANSNMPDWGFKNLERLGSKFVDNYSNAVVRIMKYLNIDESWFLNRMLMYAELGL